jgi:hypothetical protein
MIYASKIKRARYASKDDVASEVLTFRRKPLLLYRPLRQKHVNPVADHLKSEGPK